MNTLINERPDPNSASITLAKLQNPIKQGFDRVTEDLKKVYAGHNKYGKALDKVLSKDGLSKFILTLLELPD